MKIAILVSIFPPKWLGGKEIATKNIAKYLAKKGNQVDILTSQDKGLPKESREDGFRIHRISYPRIRNFGFGVFWIKLFFYLRKIDFEISHSQGVLTAIPCFLAKKILKKPYIVYCRGSDVYISWKFKKLIFKSILKNADAVVVLAADMKEKIELEKACDNKEIFVIPNGIEFDKFTNSAEKETINVPQVQKDEKIILFVGRLNQIKGIKYLIRAMGIIRGIMPKTRLLIVGYGEEKENLEKLVKELNLENCTTFTGKIPNEEISKYMMASDIFVLPSLSESFGIVNLEAMACGLPIVATRVGGIPEIVEDEENGFLVEPKNPEQIAEKILLLFKNEELSKKISNNNKEKAKKYSWDRVVEKLEEIYSKVLSSSSY